MARALANKIYRTFVKGFISEANELTYPENASIAEDNCIIYRKGNRSRRLGIDYESNFQQSDYYITGSTINDIAQKEYRWEAVSNIADLNFLVTQSGRYLYFYDMIDGAVSTERKPFTVNLNAFLAPNRTTTYNVEVQMVGGKGYLFVVGEALEPFVIEYNEDTDTITSTRIYIQIRDFKGLDDGLANDAEPSTLSKEHHYNLRNQGWVNPENDATGVNVQYFDPFGNKGTYKAPTSQPITSYFTAISRYPGNNKQWWSARDATTNEFDPQLLKTFYSGNNRAPRGHYVVDAFYIDRSAMSGIADIPPETTNDRPLSVTFFAGRVWYVCGSSVYYSQVLDDKRKAGFCYQEADPTSEDISELIPTDGGVIPIPEMSRGNKLVPLGSGVVVFGVNGIWLVSGGQGGFSATDISVSKVNPIGTESPNSVVEAEGQIYWWSRVGILGMSPKLGQFGPVEGVFDKTNISEQTIQTFYNTAIPPETKPYVKGLYDPATNVIQWLFSDDLTTPKFSYNRVLNLDLTLQAFYPWSISKSVGPYISGIFLTPRINRINHSQIKDSFFKYVVISPSLTNYRVSFGLFSSTTFSDWFTYNGAGTNYLSFVETGYELMEDSMRMKAVPWVFTYFRKTEENYVPNGDDFDVDKPSSCYFQVKWNWANSHVSGKYSTKFQAYRHTRIPLIDEADLTFDTGYPIVVSKHKVRGTGRAIQFRFESDEIGKDFDLLGWAVQIAGNTNV